MKKLLIATAIASASLTAWAAGVGDIATVTTAPYAVCDGGAGAGKTNVWGGPGEVVAAGTGVFTVAGFAVQCSNNVHMSIEEVNATLAVVGSASAKGNQYFGGHTNGGSVTAGGKCAADPCATADVTSALTKAKTDASS